MLILMFILMFADVDIVTMLATRQATTDIQYFFSFFRKLQRIFSATNFFSYTCVSVTKGYYTIVRIRILSSSDGMVASF